MSGEAQNTNKRQLLEIQTLKAESELKTKIRILNKVVVLLSIVIGGYITFKVVEFGVLKRF